MASKATAATDTTSTVSNQVFTKRTSRPANSRPAKAQEKNKDLQKTRMCTFYLQGKCALGTRCKFAHCESEIQQAPNLYKTGLCADFMKGNCNKENCPFAHGEAELVKPSSFKKAMCIWFRQGKCRNGSSCGFIHDLSELRGAAEQAPEVQEKPWRRQKPASTVEVDDDASTDVPSDSQEETVSSDVSTSGAKPMPDEHFLCMMAVGGSAPLEQKMESMSLAMGQLQAKLAQVKHLQEAVNEPQVNGRQGSKGETLRAQVTELEYAIDKLSKQMMRTEAKVRGETMPPPVAKSDRVLAKKPARGDQCAVKESAKVSAKRSYKFEMRVALGACIVAAMVLLDMSLDKIG